MAATAYGELRRPPSGRNVANGARRLPTAREVLLRRTPLRANGWLFFIVCSICLAISACYEFVEWWSAVIGGTNADDFLGAQGDVWDTQWDMLYALTGSIVAQLTLGRIHARALARLAPSPKAASV
jgi:putative membrane protein